MPPTRRGHIRVVRAFATYTNGEYDASVPLKTKERVANVEFAEITPDDTALVTVVIVRDD